MILTQKVTEGWFKERYQFLTLVLNDYVTEDKVCGMIDDVFAIAVVK